MMKNMGTLDRTIRIIVALVIGYLLISGNLTGAWAVVLGIVAVVLLVTGIVGFCPAYLPLHLSTRGKSPVQSKA